MFNGKTKTTEYGTIIVTHVCNMNCNFCCDKYRGQREYISLADVEIACQVAKEHDLKEILIVGGEPTMHPKLFEICKLIKSYGFKLILTTNYTKPHVIDGLDGIVDSFNISFYNQKKLPMQKDFKSDITITALIHKQHLSNRYELHDFIYKYKKHGHLKFSTLTVVNEWSRKMQSVPYLDTLGAKKIKLFDEIEGLKYMGCIIKRYDKVINDNAHQSLKFHVDGEISNSWDRKCNVLV